MGSVVTGTLQRDSIYAGNPAKRIKIRNPIEVVKTRLYTRQNLTCVPKDIPDWNLTNSDLIDIFGDLLKEGLKIGDFNFLFDKEYCYKVLKENLKLPDDIFKTIKILNYNYEN